MNRETTEGPWRDPHPLPSGRDRKVDTIEEWKNLVKELKETWAMLWRDRIEDRVRAEGIADKDYSKLFVERGLVIQATRDYTPLNFKEIVQQYMTEDLYNSVSPSPFVGGWGKFVRNVLSKQTRYTRRGRFTPEKPRLPENRQRKKGGRGWLHIH